jgi:hypothetical protein
MSRAETDWRLAGLVYASGDKAAASQGQHVHAGSAGRGHAVGCIVNGEAAARLYIKAPGGLGVQVVCRLAVRYVFSGDDCRELVREAECFQAGLDEQPAGS